MQQKQFYNPTSRKRKNLSQACCLTTKATRERRTKTTQSQYKERYHEDQNSMVWAQKQNYRSMEVSNFKFYQDFSQFDVKNLKHSTSRSETIFIISELIQWWSGICLQYICQQVVLAKLGLKDISLMVSHFFSLVYLSVLDFQLQCLSSLLCF